jgi:hypothetical protein
MKEDMRPENFANRYNIDWQLMRTILFYRDVNGLNSSGAVFTKGPKEHPVLYCDVQKMQKWLKTKKVL